MDPFHRVGAARAALINIVQAMDKQQFLPVQNCMYAAACAIPVLEHFDIRYRVCTGGMQHKFVPRKHFAHVWLETPFVNRESVDFYHMTMTSEDPWVTDLTCFACGVKSYMVLGKPIDMRPTSTEGTYTNLYSKAQAADLRFVPRTISWSELHALARRGSPAGVHGDATGVLTWVDENVSGDAKKFLHKIREQYAGKYKKDSAA